ncbi:carbohydrate sulfotransferase 5-like [Haemaphysalis longicornis]
MTRTYLTESPADAASSTNKTKGSLYWALRNDTKALLLNGFVSQYTKALPKEVMRILEVGYFRSGSSFLGQLLSANPRTFYHYEPLRTLNGGVRLPADDSRRGLQYIEDFFACKFEKHRDHLQLAKRYPHPFQQNTYLWDSCERVRPLCFDPMFLTTVCKAVPTQVMKVVRLDLGTALEFMLRQEPSMAGNVKVIHLVRDPRAIWTSRQRLGWCLNRVNCSSAAILCTEMERDLDAYDSFSRHSPAGVAYQVRHEDLATDTYNTTEKMFRALGLPYTAFVRRFIETHTRETNPKVRLNPYATSKNSSDVAYSWKSRLGSADVKRINKECLNVIRRLGYEL